MKHTRTSRALFAKLMRDPAVDGYGLFQPSQMELMPAAVKEMFAADHRLNAASVEELGKVDVIVAAAAWKMDDQVSAAVMKAVNDGARMLNVGGFGNHTHDDLHYQPETNVLNGLAPDTTRDIS